MDVSCSSTSSSISHSAELLKKAEPPTLNLALTLSSSSGAIPSLPTTTSATSSSSSSSLLSPTSRPLTPVSPASASSSLSTSPSALSLASTPGGSSPPFHQLFSPASMSAETMEVPVAPVPSASSSTTSASQSSSSSSQTARPQSTELKKLSSMDHVIVTLPEFVVPAPRPSPLRTGEDEAHQAAAAQSQAPPAAEPAPPAPAPAARDSAQRVPVASPNILNRHNLPFPAHHTPGSLIWAERPYLSTVNPRALYWPAEVLDLEVNPDVSRLKVRYLGPPAHLAIITGEQCKAFLSADYERLSSQSAEKDFTQALAAAIQIIKERREAKEKADAGEDNPSTPNLAINIHRPSVNSPGNIGVGTRIRLRSADIIHHKLREYAGSDAEIMEVPSHPNTWFGVRLFDGKEIKIRKSAFDVMSSPGDEKVMGSAGGGAPAGSTNGTQPSAFSSLLSGNSSSSSPMGSVSSTPRSHMSDFSRMSTPFMFAPPFTPLPVSPASFHPAFSQLMRPLMRNSLVKITLTPDTQPFPSLIGKEAQVLAVEDNGQYLIRLKDNTTVKLHRMSLQPVEDDPSSSSMPLMPMPPIFNFGFNSTPVSVKSAAPVPGGGLLRDSAGSATAEARPNTAESSNSEVSNLTVASTPRVGDKEDKDKADSDKAAAGKDSTVELSKLLPPVDGDEQHGDASLLTTPTKATDTLTVSGEIKDGVSLPGSALVTPTASTSLSLTAEGRPSSASSLAQPPAPAQMDPTALQQQQQQLMQQHMQMQQMMAMQQMYMQHLLATNPAIAPFLPFPMPPALTPISPLNMVGSLVSIISGEHTGQTATIAAVNDQAVLLKLKDADVEVVKKFAEISLLQPPPAMAGGGAGGGQQQNTAGQPGSMDGGQAGGAAVSQAMEVGSPSSGGAAAAGSQMIASSAAPPTGLPFQLPFMAGMPGLPALPGLPGMGGMPGMPFFPYPPNVRVRNPLKHRSLKNLVGKYVMVLSGPYKNEMGVVIKGSNGYFSVRLSRQFPDLKEHGGVVMKRSGDLKVLDLTQASFELMKLQMREEEAKANGERNRWLDNAKAQVHDSSDESDSSDSATDSDSDSDSDSADDSDDAKRNGAKKKRKRVSTSSSSSGSHSPSPSSSKKANAARFTSTITSTPIPASVKPESLVDSLVVVRKGRCKGEVGTVKRSGHGFYCLEILGRGEVMKRANELELINAGGAGLSGMGITGKSSALTPRRLGRVREAAKAAVAKGPEASKGGMTGNLNDAASLLMDLMGDGPDDDAADDKKKTSKGGASKKKSKKAKQASAASSSLKSSKRKEDSKKLKRKKGGASDSDLSGTSSDSDEDIRAAEREQGAKRKASLPRPEETESDYDRGGGARDEEDEMGAAARKDGKKAAAAAASSSGKVRESQQGKEKEEKVEKEEGRGKRTKRETVHP